MNADKEWQAHAERCNSVSDDDIERTAQKRVIRLTIPLFPFSRPQTCDHGPGFVCRACDPLDCYSRF